jgi:hypothetical protein
VGHFSVLSDDVCILIKNEKELFLLKSENQLPAHCYYPLVFTVLWPGGKKRQDESEKRDRDIEEKG